MHSHGQLPGGSSLLSVHGVALCSWGFSHHPPQLQTASLKYWCWLPSLWPPLYANSRAEDWARKQFISAKIQSVNTSDFTHTRQKYWSGQLDHFLHPCCGHLPSVKADPIITFFYGMVPKNDPINHKRHMNLYGTISHTQENRIPLHEKKPPYAWSCDTRWCCFQFLTIQVLINCGERPTFTCWIQTRPWPIS